jgi:PKD repeat protein
MVTDDDGDFDTLDAPIEITVESLNQPPVAVAEASATEIYPGEVVDFDGTGSFDTDGTVVEWEWDFDGDGVFGDAYYSGTDQEPSFKFDTLGQYDVDLKVTDDDDATDTLDAVITIYVVSPDNIAPVALAEVVGDNFWADQPVEFDATSSYDPDGTVVEWKWDFNNDGIFGDPFDAGTPENPQKAFAEGDHTINLRVIDNGGKSDVLDEPLEISVHPHVIITLPEDQYYKSANGYEYVVMSCVVPELIPVDYMGTNGPWDFTGHDYEADPDYLIILPPDDPEVAGYIPGTFPASTQYFLRYDATVNNIDAYMYLAEEADLDNDLLFIYGHVLKNESHPDGEEASYLPEYGGPMALQYPCSLATDELEEVNFKAEDLPFIMIRYHEVGFGEGWCTVPFDSGWTTPALLTRTLYEIEISGAPIAKGLLYKWTADDGRQLARLYAVNTTEYENFDLATFEITGQSVLTVLNDQF